MSLSPREREILAALRSRPSLDASGLAEALGTTKGAVAVALSSLAAKGEIIGRGYLLRESPSAVVVGGANWDIKARTLGPAIAGTSNPATISRTPGGVGRNIAENLARLGHHVQLVAVVGADQAGRDLVAITAAAGVDTEFVETSPHPTGSYLAALDLTGELVIGLADMVATDALQVADIVRCQEVIARTEVAVLDGNLPVGVLDWVLGVASPHAVRVVVDPVSVAKAARIAPVLDGAHPVFAVKPDVAELAALVGHPVPDSIPAIVAAARSLHPRGVEYIWVSRGAEGSLLVSQDTVLETPAVPTRVEDVTGAGDALTAGFVSGLLHGEPLDACVARGHLAAALTVQSPLTVRPDLGVALTRSLATPPAGTSPSPGTSPSQGARP